MDGGGKFKRIRNEKIFKETPILLMIAACLSGIVWFLVVTEYWLMVKFLGQTLSLTETITALPSRKNLSQASA